MSDDNHKKWVTVELHLDDLSKLRAIAEKLKIEPTDYNRVIQIAVKEFIKRNKK